MFPGLDLYYTDPVQHLITSGEGLSGLSVDDPSSVYSGWDPRYQETAV